MGEPARALKTGCRRLTALLVLLCAAGQALFSLNAAAAPAGEKNQPAHIRLILSKTIRPYVDAADALRGELDTLLDAEIKEYDLSRYEGGARRTLADQLNSRTESGLFIAVGPEAAAYLWQAVDARPGRRLYSIVLNPGKLSVPLDPDCGISLNIPPRLQVECIRKSLPQARRIGIFYDPGFNAGFYEEAKEAAREFGLVLAPLAVTSKKEIPEVLSREISDLDGIWLIPDRTVISESIAQYIIKQCILQGVPVIGYNQFFYNSGAALAFIFDYARLGRQTAHLAAQTFAAGECRARVPDFEVWINRRVYKKLDISVPELKQPLVFGQ
jgi:putative ABC transport system substrate-binding protein